MTTCPRCAETQDPATGAPTSISLCPEHALTLLGEVRRHLATTLTSLERAADRAARAAASQAPTG
jgi:hypothetical protein